MNRALLKQDAKHAMRSASPHPVVTTIAFFAIVILAVIIMISSEFVVAALSREGSGAVGVLLLCVVFLLISMILGSVQFGYYAYSLKVAQKEPTGIGELFSYIPMMIKVFGLSFWIGLFCMLWSILFIFPGIIAALRYSQAFYVMAENPDMSIRGCVNESKILMSGRLWEFFVLQLSFILWSMLVSVTCGIAGIYVLPYQQITYAEYYLELRKEYDHKKRRKANTGHRK